MAGRLQRPDQHARDVDHHLRQQCLPSDSAPDWTDYNKLIKEIRTTADFSKRVDLMHQAEDMLMDTGAVMPIYYYNDIYMLKSNIKGIYSTIYGMKYFMYATKDK